MLNLNTMVKASLGYYDTTNAYISRNRFLTLVSQILDIPPIVIIDEKSRIEVDGVPQLDLASFSNDKVVLVPQMAIFDMHNSPVEENADTHIINNVPFSIISSFNHKVICRFIRHYPRRIKRPIPLFNKGLFGSVLNQFGSLTLKPIEAYFLGIALLLS